MQSEEQVYFLINHKLPRGLCFIQTCEKFTSRKSSEQGCGKTRNGGTRNGGIRNNKSGMIKHRTHGTTNTEQ